MSYQILRLLTPLLLFGASFGIAAGVTPDEPETAADIIPTTVDLIHEQPAPINWTTHSTDTLGGPWAGRLAPTIHVIISPAPEAMPFIKATFTRTTNGANLCGAAQSVYTDFEAHPDSNNTTAIYISYGDRNPFNWPPGGQGCFLTVGTEGTIKGEVCLELDGHVSEPTRNGFDAWDSCKPLE